MGTFSQCILKSAHVASNVEMVAASDIYKAQNIGHSLLPCSELGGIETEMEENYEHSSRILATRQL